MSTLIELLQAAMCQPAPVVGATPARKSTSKKAAAAIQASKWDNALLDNLFRLCGSLGVQMQLAKVRNCPVATPFEDDAEFLSLTTCRLVCQFLMANPLGAINSAPSILQKVFEKAEMTVEDLKGAWVTLHGCFTGVINAKSKRASTPKPEGSKKGSAEGTNGNPPQMDSATPRVLRMCSRLKLSPEETDAMLFIVCSHSTGVFMHTGATNVLTPTILSVVSRLDSFALMSFLSEARKHMKQGMVGLTEAKSKGLVMECRISMPQEVVAALTGVKLTLEELVKLDKTALAEVLVAEGGHDQLPAAGMRPSRGEDEDDEDEDDSDDDDSDEGDEDPTAKVQMKRAKRSRDEAAPSATTSQLLQPTSPTGTGGSPLMQASMLAASGEMNKPYTSDVEYTDDYFKLISARIKQRYAEGDMKDDEMDFYNPKNKAEATVREFTGKQRLLRATIATRLKATAATGKGWYPEVETLSTKLKLSTFEKDLMVLMVGSVISHDVLIAINGRHVMRGDGTRELNVGFVLFVLCDTLQERVNARESFRQTAPLMDKAMISVGIGSAARNTFNTDLMDYAIDIDRKVVDLLMGLKTGTSEMVQNSNLYRPDVQCKSVVLPEDTKQKVLSTVEHYDLFNNCKKRCGFGDGLGSGNGGLVFLFHGPSGTGKTMLANGVANELGKQVLLVTLAQFKNDHKAADILRFVFREAKLNDAIIFFDECESFFESRESNPLVTSVLSQFERYDGIIIMATNRAQIIDEAMNRRISLMVEFRLPDHSMREAIWKAHLPEGIKRAEDVNVTALALAYELTGGLIKNAALAGLSMAVARDKTDNPTVTQADLVAGAKLQLRGFFQTGEGGKGSAQYVTPKRQLSEMVLEKGVNTQLTALVKMTKSRNTLFSQWGFEEHEFGDESMLCLFTGLSGTGKSMAAEGIAMECGSTMRCLNVSEMFLKQEVQIETIFEEGRKLGAVIVFDAAQLLFDRSERSQNVADLIQYHSKGYPKPVIIIATTSPSHQNVDGQACGLRLSHEVHFQLPSRTLREKLWRQAIPDKVPLSEDVDFKVLAEKPVSAKFIRSAAFNACSKVSIKLGSDNKVTIAALKAEIEAQLLLQEKLNPHFGMYV